MRNSNVLIISFFVISLLLFGCVQGNDSTGEARRSLLPISDQDPIIKIPSATIKVVVTNPVEGALKNVIVRFWFGDAHIYISETQTNSAGAATLKVDQPGTYFVTIAKNDYVNHPIVYYPVPFTQTQIVNGTTITKNLSLLRLRDISFAAMDSSISPPYNQIEGASVNLLQEINGSFEPIAGVNEIITPINGFGDFGTFLEGNYRITAERSRFEDFQLDFYHPTDFDSRLDLDMVLIPTNYCGDTVCDSDENSSTCPFDCSVNQIILKEGKGYPYGPENFSGPFDWKVDFEFGGSSGDNCLADSLCSISIFNDNERWTNSSGFNDPLYVPSQALTPEGAAGNNTATFLYNVEPDTPGKDFFNFIYEGFETNAQYSEISFRTNELTFIDESDVSHTIPYFIALTKDTFDSSFMFETNTIYYRSTGQDYDMSQTVYERKFQGGDILTPLHGANSLACQKISIQFEGISALPGGDIQAKFRLIDESGTEIDVYNAIDGENLTENFNDSDDNPALLDFVRVEDFGTTGPFSSFVDLSIQYDILGTCDDETLNWDGNVTFSTATIPTSTELDFLTIASDGRNTMYFSEDSVLSDPGVIWLPADNGLFVRYRIFADNDGLSGDLYLILDADQTFDVKFDADIKFLRTAMHQNSVYPGYFTVRPYYVPDNPDFAPLWPDPLNHYFIALFNVETGGDYQEAAEPIPDFDTSVYIDTLTDLPLSFPNSKFNSYHTATVWHTDFHIDNQLTFGMDNDPSTITQPFAAFNDWGSRFEIKSDLEFNILVPDDVRRGILSVNQGLSSKQFKTGETAGGDNFNSFPESTPEFKFALNNTTFWDLVNVTRLIKVNGTNFARTFKEHVGGTFDVFFDYQGDDGVADLEGEIGYKGMFYEVNLGTGIPKEFVDDENDNIKIPFFGDDDWLVVFTGIVADGIYTVILEREIFAECGNGILEPGELCDEGELNGSPNHCNLTCSGGTEPVCGNGVLEGGEFCDDGELNGSPNSCNLTCTGDTETICGNGALEIGEECDDGNNENGDGCFEDCRNTCAYPMHLNDVISIGERLIGLNWVYSEGINVELDSRFIVGVSEGRTAFLDFVPSFEGYAITNIDSTWHGGGASVATIEIVGGTCGPVCNNGIIEVGEECEDGNLVNGDGCSAVCLSNNCGDNEIDPGEECDDGNLVNGDGCSQICKIEICAPPASCCGGISCPSVTDVCGSCNGDACCLVCGDDICESWNGETRELCPEDCLPGSLN